MGKQYPKLSFNKPFNTRNQDSINKKKQLIKELDYGETDPRKQFNNMKNNKNIGCTFTWFITNYKKFTSEEVAFLVTRAVVPTNNINVHKVYISRDEMIHDISCSLYNVVHSPPEQTRLQKSYLNKFMKMFNTTPDNVFGFSHLSMKQILDKMVESNTDRSKLMNELCVFHNLFGISYKFGKAFGGLQSASLFCDLINELNLVGCDYSSILKQIH